MDRAPSHGDAELASTPALPSGGFPGWLSWMLPVGMATVALGGEARWADDLAVVRDLGMWPVGSEGVVSTLLTQLLASLPLGGRLMRAGLLGVLALGVGSRLAFGALRSSLDRLGSAPHGPWLALLATCLWSLSPAAQAAALALGGPLPALALVLLGARLASEAFELGEPWALGALGVVIGAALSESHAAGGVLALLACGHAALERHRAWPAHAWRLLLTLAGTLLLLTSLRWQPALVSSLMPEPPAPVESGGGALDRLRADLGGGVLLAAAAGALLAGWSRPLRSALWPRALLVALALVCPRGAIGPGGAAALSAVASAGAISFVPAALAALLRFLWRSPVPLARPAAVLAIVFAVTFVLARADGAPAAAGGRAAEVWAAEALGRLPERSVLLVHGPRLAYRLMASRVLHDTRPDVSVVPAAIVTRASIGRDLMRADAALSQLIRQLWVNGAPDEFALAGLAEDRALFVEADLRWNAHLLEHLRPAGLWLAFSASARSAPDRRRGVAESRAALRRVLERAGGEGALDGTSRRVLGDAAARQAWVLSLLGDAERGARLARAARHFDPQSRLARQLWKGGRGRARRVAHGELSR